MRTRHYNIVGPLILIAIGAIFLMSNAGLLSMSGWSLLLRLWPLLLVAWGLEGLFGNRSAIGALLVALITIGLGVLVVWYAMTTGSLNAAPLPAQSISQPLNDARDAEVTLDMSVGTLNVGALADSPNLLEGTVSAGEGVEVKPSFEQVGGTARFTLESEDLTFLFGNSPQWNFELNSRVPLALNINHSVGGATIDLSDLNLREATIEASVGESTVTLPDSGRATITLDHSVGLLRLIVPKGMDVHIEVDTGLGDVKIGRRFLRVGENTYETEGYTGADDRVEIIVDHSIGELIIE
jgi:hypothetical protein